MSLRPALDPKSVAVFGASDNPHKIGGRPLMFMQRFGYAGPVFPINPNRTLVQGFPAYGSLADLPEVPELGLIAVPGQAAIEAVEGCAKAGVKVCVVLSSGFGEVTRPDGVAQQARMVEIARAAGMRIIGPNTQGLANFHTGAVAGFSTMFVESPPMDGPVGIVSQSGGMSGVIYGMLRRQGVGVRYCNATGNDADVNVVELAAAMARDPDLRLLLVYAESIARISDLALLGQLAHERRLPVVMLKAGRTEIGQAAAKSHTGALANEDRAIGAALEEFGISRAMNVAELLAPAELYLKPWTPRGRRVAVISNSGASCVTAADAVSDQGLELAHLESDTKAQLARVLPEFASVANPIDITAALLSNSGLFGDILPILGRDPNADAFLIAIPVAGTGYDVAAFGRDAAAFARQTGKPVLIATDLPNVVAQFRAVLLPTFAHEVEAVSALAQFIRGHELLARLPRTRSWEPAGGADRRHVRQVLDEAESLGLLAARGFPVAPHRLCRSPSEARAAFGELGGPVVVKGCSRDAPHKSEFGLVRLDVRNAKQAEDAFRTMSAKLESAGFGLDGVLVAKMVSGRRELMVGARLDTVVGPIVVVGDGGKYVEALDDVQILLAPVTDHAVEQALDRLRVGPILRGVRGEPPVDLGALRRLLVGVGDLMRDEASAISSIDLNPVFVSEDGAVIADALVEVTSPEHPRSGTG
jgi:acyl-CoA synthetase (NDP forming)